MVGAGGRPVPLAGARCRGRRWSWSWAPPGAPGVFGALTGGGFDDPASESSQARERIIAELGNQDVDVLVLYSSPTATVDDPAFRDPVTATLAEVRAAARGRERDQLLRHAVAGAGLQRPARDLRGGAAQGRSARTRKTARVSKPSSRR